MKNVYISVNIDIFFVIRIIFKIEISAFQIHRGTCTNFSCYFIELQMLELNEKNLSNSNLSSLKFIKMVKKSRSAGLRSRCKKKFSWQVSS